LFSLFLFICVVSTFCNSCRTFISSFTFFIIILFLFCSTYDRNGCLAGEVLEAFKYVHNNGGITTDAEYPIVPGASYSVYQKCDLKKKNYTVTVDMTYRIKGEYKMMMYVLSGGTLAVDIDAATWSNYKSGIYSDCSTNFTINHAVNIVGVNVTGKYWIVRNSWGTKWGDKGFMKIQLVSTH
jgi:cathepsin H